MLFKAFGKIIDSDLDLNLESTQGEIDLIFRKKECIPLPEIMEETKISRFISTALVGIEQDKYYLDWPGVVRFEIVPNQSIYYSKNKETSDELLRIFILSEALGLALFAKNRFFLHGSAVNIQHQAVVFIGLPGAGKSTTIAAFAQQNFEILSDDLVLIEFDENNIPFVVPAYPEIKIWENAALQLGWETDKLKPAWEGKNKFIVDKNFSKFGEDKIPLKKIIILEIPESINIGKVNVLQFPIDLLKYFPLPHQILTTDFIKNHFEMSIQLSKNICLEHIRRPSTIEALKNFVANSSSILS